MFKAMAIKELRDTRAVVLPAVTAYVYLLATALYPRLPFGIRNEHTIPFVQDNFLAFFLFVSVAMTIAMGLRQTFGESVPGTYPFLFHRPANRPWLIGMKLFIGMSSYIICAAAPILAYGLWAATPGTHASPFEWSMTMPAWVIGFAMTLLYLGAFLSGLRPGGWYRSRLLPLAAAGLVTLALGGLGVGLERPWWAVLMTLIADTVILVAIFFVARTRDYP